MDTVRYFSIQLRLLKYCGFCLDYERTTRGKLLKYYCYYNLVHISFTIVFLIYYILTHNIEEVIESLGFSLTNFEAIVRFANFIYQRDRLNELLTEVSRNVSRGIL